MLRTMLSVILLIASHALLMGQCRTIIEGNFKSFSSHDTVLLVFPAEYPLSEIRQNGADTSIMVISAGNFHFDVSFINKLSRFDLYIRPVRSELHAILKSDIMLKNYLIEPGNSLKIEFGEQQRIFSGRGGPLAQCIQDLDSAGYRADQKRYGRQPTGIGGYYSDLFRDSLDNRYNFAVLGDFIRLSKQQQLFLHRRTISDQAYQLLKAQLLAEVNEAASGEILYAAQSPDSADQQFALRRYSSRIKIGLPAEAPELLVEDYVFTHALLTEIKSERWCKILLHEPTDASDYACIERCFSGSLRDKLLAMVLFTDAQSGRLNDSLLNYLSGVITVPRYREGVDYYRGTLLKGTLIDNFAFKDVRGRTVHLTDFRGKVVVCDLWFTGCSACVLVAKGLPTVEERFREDSSVVFLSISIDNDKAKWLRSINPETISTGINAHYRHYTTATTIYLYTGGAGANDPWIQKYSQHSYPQLYIIDRKGKMYASDAPKPFSADEQKQLIAVIREAIGK